MKKTLVAVLFFLLSFSSFSQNVGIGTTSPTTQLHVNGTVRLENLPVNNSYTTLLGIDANGNLGRKNADFWGLAGNSGTNAASNFIGTTDAADLAVRVGNFERIRISNTGAILIGGGTAGNVINTSGWSSFAAGAFNTINASDKSMLLGWNNTANAHNQYLIGVSNSATNEYSFAIGLDLRPTADKAFVIGTGTTATKLVNNNSNSLLVGFNSSQSLFVNNTATAVFTTTPTQRFHVKCDTSLANGGIRFENLPAGTGYYLTVDANGNLRRSNLQTSALVGQNNNDDEIKKMRTTLDETRRQLEALQKKLDMILSRMVQSN